MLYKKYKGGGEIEMVFLLGKVFINSVITPHSFVSNTTVILSSYEVVD
jgi:hypothetical protein